VYWVLSLMLYSSFSYNLLSILSGTPMSFSFFSAYSRLILPSWYCLITPSPTITQAGIMLFQLIIYPIINLESSTNPNKASDTPATTSDRIRQPDRCPQCSKYSYYKEERYNVYFHLINALPVQSTQEPLVTYLCSAYHCKLGQPVHQQQDLQDH